jgi:magnesium transporter
VQPVSEAVPGGLAEARFQLLIGTGGNIGSQTTTMLVRAMGLGEVRLRDVGRVLAKEIVVGLVLGAIMAVVAYSRA